MATAGFSNPYLGQQANALQTQANPEPAVQPAAEFRRSYLERHPEEQDLLAAPQGHGGTPYRQPVVHSRYLSDGNRR